MTRPFTVRRADWTADADSIRRVREAVFVVEQSVDPMLEWDGLDEACIQVIAEDENRDAIGTGRVHPSGKLGRMAVMPPWRGRGVGAEIMRCLIDAARQGGLEEVFLHAQSQVVGFYAGFGFEVEGEEFQEAGIPHRFMRRRLADD
jgi:predicted GNAT family N-acyltransferase